MFLTDTKIKRSDNLTYVIARYQEDISWADNINLKICSSKRFTFTEFRTRGIFLLMVY
jgi:hypothetical protein